MKRHARLEQATSALAGVLCGNSSRGGAKSTDVLNETLQTGHLIGQGQSVAVALLLYTHTQSTSCTQHIIDVTYFG